MKKIMLGMPLLAISLLTNCQGNREYKFTFNCFFCKVLNDKREEITSINVNAPTDPHTTTYNKFYLKVDDTHALPKKSLIDVKNDENQAVDFIYDSLTGEIGLPLVSNLTITAFGYRSLNDCTWSEIETISNSGIASTYFNLGEEKTVKLTDDVSHKIRIIDFEKDVDPNGNPIGITFEFANVITVLDSNLVALSEQWNDAESNCDYRNSTLNKSLNSDVLAMLPSDPINKDLKEVIKPVDKKVGASFNGGTTYEAVSFDGDTYPYPYLFPLSFDEISTQSDPNVTEGEGITYEYYVGHPTEEDRIKKSTVGFAKRYWLRSPSKKNAKEAFVVEGDGAFNDFTCVGTYSVAPAFCI